MKRRLAALFTALCLLTGTLVIPAKAEMICRITRQVMRPVAQDRVQGSCCGVTLTASADGSLRYALSRPGCCDLQQSPQRSELPATVAVTPDGVAVATLPDVPILPTPLRGEAILPSPVVEESAARAPPIPRASPRAPPVLS